MSVKTITAVCKTLDVVYARVWCKHLSVGAMLWYIFQGSTIWNLRGHSYCKRPQARRVERRGAEVTRAPAHYQNVYLPNTGAHRKKKSSRLLYELLWFLSKTLEMSELGLHDPFFSVELPQVWVIQTGYEHEHLNSGNDVRVLVFAWHDLCI